MEIDLLINESEYDSQYPIHFQMVSHVKQFSIPHLKNTLKPTFMVFKMNILRSEMVSRTACMPMAGAVGLLGFSSCGMPKLRAQNLRPLRPLYKRIRKRILFFSSSSSNFSQPSEVGEKREKGENHHFWS